MGTGQCSPCLPREPTYGEADLYAQVRLMSSSIQGVSLARPCPIDRECSGAWVRGTSGPNLGGFHFPGLVSCLGFPRERDPFSSPQRHFLLGQAPRAPSA